MDRRQLKNVIIIILLLVNGFLVGSLVSRSTAARTAQSRSAQQLAELFDADGIQLDPDSIPSEEPPASRVLTRDSALERTAADHLLSGGLRRSEQAGVCSYSGAKGAALFRENGSFEAAGTLASGNGEDFCRAFCRDFHYAVSSVQVDEDGSGAVTALREYGGLTVSNCVVTFTLEQGAVTAVRGTLLPDASVESAAGDQSPLSAQAALTAFLDMRRETGAVASSITDISLCYELQSSAAAPMSLVPAWRIATDTVSYYVNCITGVVSQY